MISGSLGYRVFRETGPGFESWPETLCCVLGQDTLIYSHTASIHPLHGGEQCGLCSIPGPGVICGLSLLLVLYSAQRVFSPGTPVFPLFLKTISLGVVKFGESIDWESVFCPSLLRNAPMLVSGFLRLSRARYCSPPCWIA